MIISRDPPFVFIHVPKTAGYSVELALSKYAPAPKHADYRWYNPFNPDYQPLPAESADVVHTPASKLGDILDPEYLKQATTFGFVRNPWDWLVSYYSFGKVSGPREARPEFDKRFPTFKDWVRDALLADNRWLEKTYGRYAHRIKVPQHHYLLEEGRLAVDFMGRFEALEEDFRKACKLAQVPDSLPLGHTHRSAHGTYRDYYDDETLEMVQAVVAEDAHQFGYRF